MAVKTIISRQKREALGRRAETLASWYLRAKGYRILARRYKSRHGEIDIIARKKGTLAIIEVKYRQSRRMAEDSISIKARKRIGRATQDYVAHHKTAQGLAIRFDAIYQIPKMRLIHKIDLWREY